MAKNKQTNKQTNKQKTNKKKLEQTVLQFHGLNKDPVDES